ncbi:MAG: DNA translocase FtsK 4TM domain-containing protein [Paludibacteraceae bacterium]|nr:DNA translocase FtsK 4TM domain-containing protein [Paludibacteraceae bacterium]
MAPRRPVREKRTTPEDDFNQIDDFGQNNGFDNKEIKVESAWKQRFKQILSDDRVRIACGIVLLAVALYALVAVVSFFFTGQADFSVLDNPPQGIRALRREIQNWVGVVGARLSRWLIDSTFGISSVAMLVFVFMSGLRLLGVKSVNVLKTFFHSLFWLVWGSFAFAFVQQSLNLNLFFRLGGKHGQQFVGWAMSYIEALGVLLVLVVSLLIYFIIIDRNTIPNLVRLWQWLKGLFKRKPKPVVQTIDGPTIETNDDDLAGEIEQIGTVAEREDADEVEENGEEDDNDNNGTNGGGIVINETFEEEMVEENKDDDNQDDDNKEGSEVKMEIKEGVEEELAENDPEYLLKKLGPYDPRKDLEYFKFPSISLLRTYDNETKPIIDIEEQEANQKKIEHALNSYGIGIKQISATVGPTVTLYEIVLQEGIKLSRIKNLEDDIMMSLAAKGIRIIAPIPGKSAVGIEVPNEKAQIVSMHSLIASKKFQEEKKMDLPVAIGKTITNEIFMFDLAKTPHLLVAGATGMGKSVGLNAIITSLLYKKHPSELKLVLVDPKMVEFTLYRPLIKHYLAAMPDVEPEDIIITDSSKVINTLNSLVIEMEDRYKLVMAAGCRNIKEYNQKFINRRLSPDKGHHYMPYIVTIIDEFGDFILVAGKEVERPIQRLTQKARAVGIHLILATQRPSVNVITGVIKANVPTRISFAVRSIVDSRTILDQKGAEQLIGRGDMLYFSGQDPVRIQCALVETEEVEEIVKSISEQQGFLDCYALPDYVPEGGGDTGESRSGQVDTKRLDPLFEEVAHFVVENQQGSTSVLQRKFEIGYNRAGKLTDQLEAVGIVGPNNGPKGRQVLVQDPGTLEQILSGLRQPKV